MYRTPAIPTPAPAPESHISVIDGITIAGPLPLTDGPVRADSLDVYPPPRWADEVPPPAAPALPAVPATPAPDPGPGTAAALMRAMAAGLAAMADAITTRDDT